MIAFAKVFNVYTISAWRTLMCGTAIGIDLKSCGDLWDRQVIFLVAFRISDSSWLTGGAYRRPLSTGRVA